MRLKERLYGLVHKKPYGTEATVFRSDIIIPKNFTKYRRKPAEWKMIRAREFYDKHGYVDKPIEVIPIVNERKRNKYLLVDSYTRYLVLCENKIPMTPVKLQGEYII